MADVILLVHDDIGAIATVRRLLFRGGYEVVLATSVADAVIAFTHHLPSLILLAPSIEGGRGRAVLDELSEQCERKPASVLLLGESIPGLDLQVVPLPLDGNSFLEIVRSHVHPNAAFEGQEPRPNHSEPPARYSANNSTTLAAQAEAAAQAALELAHQEIEAEAFATLETALSQALTQMPGAAESEEPQLNEREFHALEQDVLREAAARRESQKRQQLASELNETAEDLPTYVQFSPLAADAEMGNGESADARNQVEEAAQAAVKEREAREAALAEVARAGVEKGAIWSAPLPNGETAQLPTAGTIAIEGLGELLVPLCLSGCDLRLDLRAPGTLRSLWLRQGMLVAAHSSLNDETLIARARRDGLITGTQSNELRTLESTDIAGAVEILMARQYLRESEVVPLLQRHYEAIALSAISELESLYRLREDPVPQSMVMAPGSRPALHLFCEGIRRALSSEQAVAMLGSLASVPVLTDAALGVRDLGLSERERDFIQEFDGEVSVAEALARTGFPQEPGVRLLAAAGVLGAVRVRRIQEETESSTHSLDIERLEAKFEQVQNGDYFSILGLPKSAGAAEVQRAFGLLSAEFHPLKFALHPDPSLQQRAQHVHDALVEAASVLQDDRLRSQYAVNLLD